MAHRQAPVRVNAKRVLRRHERHGKAGAVRVPPSTAAKRCGREKMMFSEGNKMFLSPKEALE